MHFIPYYKNKNWQRFFVGLFIGAIISYFIFIYMYGQLLEKRIGKEVTTLTNHYPLLIRSIENKTYKINDFSYRANIKHLFINENSQIHVELDF